MTCRIILVVFAVLLQYDAVSAQESQESKTTAAELWNPSTWFYPFAIAASEGYRDYYIKAQKAQNDLYKQIYETNAFPWVTGNWGPAPGGKPKEEKKPEKPKEENKPEKPKEENKPEKSKEENKPEKPKEENKPEKPKPEEKPEEGKTGAKVETDDAKAEADAGKGKADAKAEADAGKGKADAKAEADAEKGKADAKVNDEKAKEDQ